MSRLTAIVLVFALWAAIACVNDSPTHFEPPTDLSGDATEVESVPEATKSRAVTTMPVAEASPKQQQSSVSRSRVEYQAHLSIEVEAELDVYEWPLADIVPVTRLGSGSVVRADGWIQSPDSPVWIRLNLVGEAIGWVKLGDTSLTTDDLRTLRRVPAPRLPIVPVSFGQGRDLQVRLLGRLADNQVERVVILLPGGVTPLWTYRSTLDQYSTLPTLPTYTGEVSGYWMPHAVSSPPPRVVRVSRWGASLAAWPGGPYLRYVLRGGTYPLLGRSFDHQWIAVRLERIDPAIGWIAADAAENELETESLPIVLSTGLEIFEFDELGHLTGSMLIQAPNTWEWHTDEEFLVSRYIDGERFGEAWNPWTDERRPVSDMLFGDVSPDGRYVADVEWMDLSDDRGYDIALIHLNSGEQVRFENVSRPIPTDCCWPSTRWSPDSRWYLTVLFSRDPAVSTRVFALGIDGRRVEIVTDIRWADRWQVVADLGDDTIYLDEDGNEIEAPWTGVALKALAPTWKRVPRLDSGWQGAKWSPEGRLILATRIVKSDEFTENGLAALPAKLGDGWGFLEIGVFDASGNLTQSFRGYGWHCWSMRSEASWSPSGSRLAVGPGYFHCQ